jgi:RNA polymerase sigma-70 factor (ECF subfamily)
MKAYAGMTEQQLIGAAKKGNRQAFAALVKRYEETVFRFSFKMCRDPEKAKEILQDTFISVYRKLGSFDGKSKFSTWLYTIVANHCLMRQRRRKIQELIDPLELYDEPFEGGDAHGRAQVAAGEETPADILLTKELRAALDAAIQKLPVEYRLVFVLRDVEGKSTEETARMLTLSIEATKSRLRRARAFLRDQLRPYVATREGA